MSLWPIVVVVVVPPPLLSTPTNAPSSIENPLWASCGWTRTHTKEFHLGNLSYIHPTSITSHKLRWLSMYVISKNSFHMMLFWPRLSSFLSACLLHCCSHMYDYYHYLEPCALNVEFQHFIPRFNKNLPYFAELTQRRGKYRGWKKGPKTGWVKTGWL
jgi:hypothetical protein